MIKVGDLSRDFESLKTNNDYAQSYYASLLRVLICHEYNLQDEQIIAIAKSLRSARTNLSRSKIISLLDEISPRSD